MFRETSSIDEPKNPQKARLNKGAPNFHQLKFKLRFLNVLEVTL